MSAKTEYEAGHLYANRNHANTLLDAIDDLPRPLSVEFVAGFYQRRIEELQVRLGTRPMKLSETVGGGELLTPETVLAARRATTPRACDRMIDGHACCESVVDVGPTEWGQCTHCKLFYYSEPQPHIA